MNKYIVVSASKSDYQHWMINLMDFSMKKYKQEGQLVVLSNEQYKTNIPLPSDAIVYNFPDFSLSWNPNGNDNYCVANRHMTLSLVCQNNLFNDDDVFLMVDPDMVFIDNSFYIPEPNEVIGQDFNYGFQPIEGWNYEINDTIRYPFFIRFDTLKKIINEYCDFSNKIRTDTDKWEADMYGLSYAMSLHKIKTRSLTNLGVCNDWQVKPNWIIHYCQQVKDENSNIIFGKTEFYKNPIHLEYNNSLNDSNKLLFELINKFIEIA